MNSEPVPPGKLFLAIDGKPHGPHTAASVMKLWREGAIKDDTLICPDGGAAWVSLKEFEPALRAELPPVPPAGNGRIAAAAPAQPAAPPASYEVVAERSGGGGGGTGLARIGSLLAALILFFLPWLEMRCQGQRLMYQTGVDTILDSGAMDSEFKKLGGVPQSGGSRLPKEDKLDAGRSILAGAALLALIIALVASIGSTGKYTAGLLAAVAIACLVIQAVIGFPIESKLKKETEVRWPGGMERVETEDPGGKANLRMNKMNPFVIKYTPWFYAELAALVVAAALALGSGGGRVSPKVSVHQA